MGFTNQLITMGHHLVLKHIKTLKSQQRIAVWNSLMGKSSINGPFPMAMLNNQRVVTDHGPSLRTWARNNVLTDSLRLSVAKSFRNRSQLCDVLCILTWLSFQVIIFPVRGVLGLGIVMLFFGHQDATQQRKA